MLVRNPNEVGALLKELRLRSDFNQKQAADLAEISVPLLSRVEDGSRMPSLWTLFKLIHVYDSDVHVVLREELNAPNRPAETHRE